MRNKKRERKTKQEREDKRRGPLRHGQLPGDMNTKDSATVACVILRVLAEVCAHECCLK